MESRRSFLKYMAGLTAGLVLPVPWSCGNSTRTRDKFGDLLPLRKLGKTGEMVTMLGVGGFHIGWTSERDAQEVIETAIAGGIRFFDTAHNYGKGASEERYGKFLVPGFRDQIFLMTKTQARDDKSLLEEVDLSLKRLNTERVDLLQIHSLQNPDDVDRREANGVLEAMLQIKESGKAKHIGFTGHQNPYAHLRMMEKLNDYPAFATVQMPLNLVDFASDHSFVKDTLPAAMKWELGVLAMKTLADGRFFAHKQMNERVVWNSQSPVIPGYLSLKECLFFSWSLPISVLITGAENSEFIKEKISLAKEFVAQSENEKTKLLDRVSQVPVPEKIEYYKNIEG